MSRVSLNPGCRHDCHLTRESGFVIEEGCPIHDRPGYRPFVVVWIGPRPILVSTITLGVYGSPEDHAHEHVHAFAFAAGLN